MFFSENNKNITYSNHWDGLLAVCGNGPVVKADTNIFPAPRKNWSSEFTKLGLTNGITSVGPGFIESFKNLKTLVISYTVKDIAMTPELKALLQRNNVLIRGWFDSFGERFAKENGLKFLHADIVVGWYSDEAHYTNTRFEIRWRPDGKPYRFYDDVCPGISAGNNGGGTYEREIEPDFYVGLTLEEFAEWFPRYTDVILKNKDLEYFFRTAGKRR